MNEDYYISEDQLGLITHYKRMFELEASSIQELCKIERDDIVYGFELGLMHSNLRDHFIQMDKLIDEIKNQSLIKINK